MEKSYSSLSSFRFSLSILFFFPIVFMPLKNLSISCQIDIYYCKIISCGDCIYVLI